MSQQVLTFAGSPLSGAALVAALEAKLQSLASNRSGTSRPSDIQTGEVWLDTTTATAQLLKFWDGADDITLATINATTNTVTFTGTATSGANSNITSLAGLTTPLSVAQGGTGGATASSARTALGLGNAATLTAGTAANNLVQLDANAQIPAVSGALLTGITASQISGLSSGMPTGAVVAVASSSVPTDFLECNGAAVSRTTYAALFAAIGVVHGYGDNSTTFNLPDYRGRFLRGWDHAIARDPDRASRTAMNTGGAAGDTVGSVQADAFKSHTHTVPHSNSSNSNGLAMDTLNVSGYSNAGSTGGNETRPINANVMYCIKY